MSRPAWLAENVVAGLQDLVARLDAIAVGNALDPARAVRVSVAVASGPAPSLSVSAPTARVAGVSAALVALYNVLPVLVSRTTGVDPSVVPALFALSRGIGAAMAPADAMAVFASAVDDVPDAAPAATAGQNRRDDAANLMVVARVSRAVLLAPYAEALATMDYGSRPEGVTARADCVERFEREIGLATGSGGGDAALALVTQRDRVVDYLSRVITTLADVVTARAERSLPSLWWAWRLYEDPSRAPDLVARNDIAHPSFMPLSFQALKSKG